MGPMIYHSPKSQIRSLSEANSWQDFLQRSRDQHHRLEDCANVHRENLSQAKKSFTAFFNGFVFFNPSFGENSFWRQSSQSHKIALHFFCLRKLIVSCIFRTSGFINLCLRLRTNNPLFSSSLKYFFYFLLFYFQ